MAGPPPGDYDGTPTRPPDSANPSGPSDIPSSKPGWFDPQHNMPSWNPQQPVSQLTHDDNVLCLSGSSENLNGYLLLQEVGTCSVHNVNVDGRWKFLDGVLLCDLKQ